MAVLANITQAATVTNKTASVEQQKEALATPTAPSNEGAVVDARNTDRLKGYQGVISYPPDLLRQAPGYLEILLWRQQQSRTSKLFQEIESALTKVSSDGPGRAMQAIGDSLASMSLDVTDLGGYDFSGSVIQLPLSGGAGDNKQEISYNTNDVGVIFGNSLPSGPGDVTRSFTDVMKMAGGGLAVNKLLSSIGSTLQNLGLTSSDVTESVYQTKFGSTFVPYSYTLFDSVQHRTYNLEYYFSPRNAREQEILYAIIDTIQLAAYPERRNLIFHALPNAFQIKYSFNTSSNPWFLESSLCYLNSFSHVPLGDSTRLHADGSPISHKISMSFIELRPWDRDVFFRKLSEQRQSKLGSNK